MKNTRVFVFILTNLITSFVFSFCIGYTSYLYFITTLILGLLVSRSRINQVISLFFYVPASLYLYIGLNWGSPSIGLIVPLFETYRSETLEFISMVPIKIILQTIGLIIISITLIFSLKVNVNFKKKGNHKYYLSVFLWLLALLLVARFSVFYELIEDAKRSYRQYKTAQYKFEQARSQKSSWKIDSVNSRYKNYVLIIGESMRRDYMSLYGYPLNTTPFLKQVNGVFLSNYISAAPNTTASLTRTLVRTSDNGLNVIYKDTIIDLAKSAGFKTYWLSNQGHIGVADTDVARIGVKSDYSFFTKKAEYDTENFSDDVLLKNVKEALDDSAGKRLIVVHIMGSHPYACERLHGHQVEFKTNISHTVDCYLQSYKLTDGFINSIYDILKNKHEPFSINYFSDHGVSISAEKEGKQQIKFTNKYQQNYEVPFLFINSDSEDHVIINNPVSAFSYNQIFATWLGIKESSLKPFNVLQDDNKQRSVFNWKEIVSFESLEREKTILPH